MKELIWVIAAVLSLPTVGLVINLSGKLLDRIKSNKFFNVACVIHALVSTLSILFWPAIAMLLTF